MIVNIAYTGAVVACMCVCCDIVLTAPPPREVGFVHTFEGRVASLDHEGITLRGFALEVDAVQRRTKEMRGRKRVLHLYGAKLSVIGTCGAVQATEVEWTLYESATITSIDGRKITLSREDQPLRTFELSDQLRAGGYSTGHGASYSYRIQNVAVGDDVSLRFRRDEEVPRLCEAIAIVRRPNGRIPRAPDQEATDRFPHHERMQAEQDWEEKGVPLPPQYQWLRAPK